MFGTLGFMAGQHYVPASLIGQFGERGSTKRARERRVWVARRGSKAPFLKRGEGVGVDNGHPDIYGPADVGLDQLWQASEGRLEGVLKALDLGLQTNKMPLHLFVSHVVPYVAQLLARHPELLLDRLTDLRQSRTGHDLRERGEGFIQFVDALLYGREWAVLKVDPPEYFVGTDIGWLWMPGRMPGTILVPMAADRAFIVRGGVPSYTHRTEEIRLGPAWMAAGQVRDVRHGMILGAPRDVYTDSKERAQEALDLWSNPAPPGDRLSNAQALGYRNPAHIVGPLRGGAVENPSLAWGRFLLATHRVGPCHCEHGLQALGLNEAELTKRRQWHADLQRVALESLTPAQLGREPSPVEL